MKAVKTCWPFPPPISTQCTFYIPEENCVQMVQCQEDIEWFLTHQDEPGIIGDRRKQFIYRA